MNQGMILEALNSRYCCLKEPSAALHQAYDRRYLTSLRVYGTREDDGSQSPRTLSQHIIDPQILKKKITAAISAISFRDRHVLVQFWSPVTVTGSNRCLLITLDQPFGIGVVNEALYKYRLESEQRMFAVDGEHIEELGGSPGRVYHQKLPEWSLDIQGLPTSQNIKDSNACYNIHGYLSLPVLDPASGCCVGVLELITLSKHVDYAFEVLEISKALKEQDLKTSNAFEDPSFCELPSEDRKIQIAKINDILIVMCDTHNLPLAQTWELSPLSSHVSHEKSIQKSCSSFNSRCIGKVCISTAGLPFYVRDLSMWEFHKACMEQHLEKSRGVVGRALLSQGTRYCENVTKLSEEEYPLVHNACKSGLGGCFAIFLRGVEGRNDYILEFFMPSDIKDSTVSYVLNLVEKLKRKIEDASGFEIGDISMKVIRPPSVVNNLSSMTEVDTPNEIIPNLFVTNVATIACGAYANVSMQKTRDKGYDAGEPSNRLMKRKRDSLTMEAVEKLFGQPMDEACKSLEVSRSTLKRFLRARGILRWPVSKVSDRSACVTDSNLHLPVSKVTKSKTDSLVFRLPEPEMLTLESDKIFTSIGVLLCIKGLVAGFICIFGGEPPTLKRATMWYPPKPCKKSSSVRIAIAHQNEVFDSTTYMEQATNNVDSLMDVDLATIKDLNSIDAIPALSSDNFIDDQGSSRMEPYGIENSTAAIRIDNVPLTDHNVTDYPVYSPMLNSGSIDGIENPMVETGMGMEGAWPSPISLGDMHSFGANPSDYDFSNPVFDDQLFY